MAIQWTAQERVLARKWCNAQRTAGKFLAQEKMAQLRTRTAQQSFRDFLDLWDFYWGSPEATQVMQPRDNAHRLRLVQVFQQLRKHAG